MSIQPNRVIARIIEQVDQSDWPRLPSQVVLAPATGESIRLFRVVRADRYATPLHFWVHALRDELSAVGRREDLMGAAGHALGHAQSLADWLSELAGVCAEGGETAAERFALSEARLRSATEVGGAAAAPRVYRMLESACRRSSVVEGGDELIAHFWGHGCFPTWRGRVLS